MATLVLDHIVDAMATMREETLSTPAGQIIRPVYEYHRRGYVQDITVPNDCQDILIDVMSMSGMPAYGNSLSSTYPNMTLRAIQVVSVSNFKRLVTLDLYYTDRPNYINSGGIGVTYQRRIRSALQSVTVGFNPYNGDEFRWQYKRSLDSSPEEENDSMDVPKSKPFNTTIMIPMAQIAIDAVYSSSQTSFLPYVGHVNDSTWFGLAKGFWRIDSADNQDAGSLHTASIQASSNIRFPWSQFEILYNTNVNRYVKVDSTAFKDDVANHAYSQGVHIQNGYTIIDPYPTANFGTIFGMGT